MHEADHLSLFSAEVTDRCSCNCASAKCLHGVHTDSFTFYHCFGGMNGCNSVPQKMRAVWSHGTLYHPTVLFCVKTQNVVV